MDRKTLAEQAQIEDQALHHVMLALKTALAWQVSESGVGRKLSSVRFMAQSLERHLRRLMALEEDGGYLAVVTETKPCLSEKVAPLHADHLRFEETLDRLMGNLRQLQDHPQRDALDLACHRLDTLIQEIDRHNRAEAALVQQVLCEDEGGEG